MALCHHLQVHTITKTIWDSSKCPFCPFNQPALGSAMYTIEEIGEALYTKVSLYHLCTIAYKFGVVKFMRLLRNTVDDFWVRIFTLFIWSYLCCLDVEWIFLCCITAVELNDCIHSTENEIWPRLPCSHQGAVFAWTSSSGRVCSVHCTSTVFCKVATTARIRKFLIVIIIQKNIFAVSNYNIILNI